MTKIRSEYEIALKDETSRTLGRITAGFDKFKTAIAGLSVAGAAAAVVSEIRSATNLADDLNKAAQKTGVTVEALSALNYAAKLSDVSTEGLVGGIQKLSKTMADAAEAAGDQRTAFEATGIAFKNADGTLRGTTEVFSDIAKFFATLPDGATKTALAMQFFGKAGAELIPLLNGNADGFKAVTAEAKQFGLIISKDLAQQSENLNDNFTRLASASDALGISLASKIVPGLADLTTEFVRNLAQAKGLEQSLAALGTSIAAVARGNDKERLGDLLGDEAELQKQIEQLQAAFDAGDTGKLVFIGRMKLLKDELASVRAEAEGLRVVMQPKDLPGADPKELDGPPISDAQRKANEARVRAALDAAAAEAALSKKRQAEKERLVKAQEDYLAKQRESLAIDQDASEEAKVLADIKFGAASKFSDAAKEEALKNAINLDILEGTAEVHQVLNGYVRERAELEGKATQQLVDSRQAVIDSLMTPLEKYTERVKELLALQLNPEQLSRGITLAKIELTDAQSKASGLQDTVRDLGVTFSSSFAQAITNGKKLLDIINSLGRDIATILLNKSITVPLGNLLGGTAGSPGLIEKGAGSIGTWLGSLLGRASGGPTNAGQAYIVGERGPELFVSDQAGRIIPNGGAGGGGMKVIVNNYSPERVSVRQSPGGRRDLEITIGQLMTGNIQAGRGASSGMLPPLAAR